MHGDRGSSCISGNTRSRSRAPQLRAALRDVQFTAADENAQRIRANLMNFMLGTTAMAALRLARDAEAEDALRERLSLPANPFTGADPLDEVSRSQVMLAHAVVRQDRGAEAREILRPALQHYRAEQEHGLGGITFQRDLAYALYVNALAQDDGASGRRERNASLDEAAGLLAAMPAEARQLWDVREVAGLIAAARGG